MDGMLKVKAGPKGLTISISYKSLAVAADYVLDGFKVVDPVVFGKEVAHMLQDEEEDGTTLVHRMFDDAFREVVEQGGEGVEELEELEDDEGEDEEE